MQADQSVEKGLNSTNVAKALISQFKIPEHYEFQRQVIKGTKDKMSEKDELGYEHERYSQFYKGIKIEHSDIRVHYLNGLFVSANGEYIDAKDIDVSIIISKEKAIEKAIEYIGAKEYMWENESENNWLKNTTNDNTVSFYPNAEIVICKNSIDIKDTAFYIAYKIDIYAKEPVRRDYIFVDAKSGNILAVNPILVNATGTATTRYSGTRNISTQQNGNTFRLRGYDNNRSVETYNMKKGTNYNTAVDFTDNNNNWTATEFHNANKDDAALEAHWSAMMTYDYFKNIHRRNSFDNNGSTVKCYVHYGVNYVNAFWDGSVLTFGDGNGTTVDTYVSLDVVAHVFAHGVCANTAELVYSGESGAINESLSDIWGACVENHVNNQYGTNKDVWLHREEVGTPNRSLSNPENYGQPDTYGAGPYWYGSNAGVHTNSGIMNYWFYLLSVGGSGSNDLGNSYNVTGIGMDKAAKIVYYAETEYMTSGTNFAAARTHTITAATYFYGAGSAEVIAVTNAWYAVGVGNSYPPTLTGPTLVLNSGSTYTMHGANGGSVTWSCSSNLQKLSSSGASATFGPLYPLSNSPGWIQASIGGGTPVRYEVWVGKPVITGIAGNMNPGTSGNYNEYGAYYDEKAGIPYGGFEWILNPSNAGYIIDANTSSPDIMFSSSGNWQLLVRATNANGTGDYYSIRLNSGKSSTSLYQVYPNPVSDELTVSLRTQLSSAPIQSSAGSNTAGNKAYAVYLYNANGASVRQAVSQGDQTQLNVSGLPDGIYYLVIDAGDGSKPETHKIIVKH